MGECSHSRGKGTFLISFIFPLTWQTEIRDYNIFHALHAQDTLSHCPTDMST